MSTTTPYPSMQRLAVATPAQLWEWYAQLPTPKTPGERQILVETMRRLNLIPGRCSPQEGEARSDGRRVTD
jgi:hypothetical protein